MSRWRLSMRAKADAVEVISWTARNFGSDAALKYRLLIASAVVALGDDPYRRGSRDIDSLCMGARLWHLRYALKGSGLRRARHMLIYRVEPDALAVGRLLHEKMELPDRLAAPDLWT